VYTLFVLYSSSYPFPRHLPPSTGINSPSTGQDRFCPTVL
jgi:hypothetical protein